FVDAVLGGLDAQLPGLRASVRSAVGDAGFVDTCATIASFNAVVKLADGTGIPLEDWKESRTRDIRDALSIDAFRGQRVALACSRRHRGHRAPRRDRCTGSSQTGKRLALRERVLTRPTPVRFTPGRALRIACEGRNLPWKRR